MTVNAFMADLEYPHKAAVQDLRALVRSTDARIKEEVKWNAPIFFIDEHFATFKLHPRNKVQLVLHTGAKVKAKQQVFQVDDPHSLLSWPAVDRAVVTFESREHAARAAPALRAILRQWIVQV